MSVAYSDWINEVLVKVIHKFRYSPFEGGGYPEIVENRQMLYTLTQTDSAGMGADWNVELRRHEQYRQIFIDSGKPTTVDLTHIDGFCLH